MLNNIRTGYVNDKMSRGHSQASQVGSSETFMDESVSFVFPFCAEGRLQFWLLLVALSNDAWQMLNGQTGDMGISIANTCSLLHLNSWLLVRFKECEPAQPLNWKQRETRSEKESSSEPLMLANFYFFFYSKGRKANLVWTICLGCANCKITLRKHHVSQCVIHFSKPKELHRERESTKAAFPVCLILL